MYPYLPKQVIQQFKYIQGISRAHIVFVSPTITRKDVYSIFEVFYDHLVPADVHRVSTQLWSAVYDYIQ